MQQCPRFDSSSPHSYEGDVGRSIVKMESTKDPFPAGLRVLVVDDDPICLMILERMLRRCSYEVTTCAAATSALDMLRQNKNRFDLVISDVYMPDMDGFKLLELVGLEMDLPVIMMSTDGETSAVMKGITHGACDYLLKPVRLEELKNIWQHVVRKRRNEGKDVEHSASIEDNERSKRFIEDNEQIGPLISKKRKDVKEEDDDNDQETDDPTAPKKARVVWSVELHQQFVGAVNQLGIDKAVPKRILELMGVQGLTRENVASHLQKYRLFLKRLSVAPHHNPVNLPFSGGQESSGTNDLRSLTTSGHLSAQALASVHSGIPGTLDSSVWLQLAALQGSNYGSVRQRPQTPWLNAQGNIVQALSGGVDIDHVAQTQQIAALGQQGLLVDNSAGKNSMQNQVSLNQLGRMRSMASIGDSDFDITGSTALMRHLLHQHQVQNKSVVGPNLPVGTFSGQNMIPVEINSHVVQLPKTGSANSCFSSQAGSLDLSSSGMIPDSCIGVRGSSVSHELDSFLIASNADSKSHCLSGADFQAINGTYANTQVAPTGLTAAVTESGTHLVSVNDNYNLQAIGGPRPNFSVLGNLSCRIGPGRQPRSSGWQCQNAVQDPVQPSHPFESTFHSQILNANQDMSTVFGQNQEEYFELPRPGLDFPRNAESSYSRPPFKSTCTKIEQAITESNHKPKEEWMLDSASKKLESAVSMFRDSSSDDLMTLFMKQGMMGFTETDSALDGYAAEICS
ncbi:hypothetical protein O6H91_05G055000 [Diphasiastrum complanatum]|uniref:Uncharacterized protein n=1 Tax=Diphasiastrum complanatum TaxID=34168 RepID=A0ACC2DNV9_DIPCM|nr:hypothetical protein O6H91_05G055000 [Diphasiastrum complanatum]